MDRKTRRMRRLRVRSRTRRTKLIAGAAVAVASMVVLGATAFGQQGPGTPEKPPPVVDEADLTANRLPVAPGWEAQVGTDANLVGVQWSGDQGAEFTVEVRDGDGDWRKGADVGANDALPDPGSPDAVATAAHTDKNVSEPIWVGKDASGVRVRLDDGTAQDLKLHVVDSTRGERPATSLESAGTPATPTTPAPTSTSAAASGPPPTADGDPGGAVTTTTQATQSGIGLGPGLAAAALATVAVAFIVRRRRLLAIVIVVAVALLACAPAKKGPPSPSASIPAGIVARSTWAPDLPWNWGACPGGPEYAWVGTAIVHHTVNSNFYGPGDSVGIMRGIWAYHVRSLGYCDIAYNFIIDNYGVPFEGRLGGIDQPVIGAHSLNFNTGTTGIAMLGTFISVTPSSGALGTLENLIRWKFKVHGVNPFDDAASDILGHRDVFPTQCPGQALYNYLPFTRSSMKAFW